MAHASHFLGVAAEALRRRGQPELACQLAWAVRETFLHRDEPRARDLVAWVDACRALGPAPDEPLDREEAVALAVAAILSAP